MPNSSIQSLDVTHVVDLLFAYMKSLGKDAPEAWDPSMTPCKDFGLKSRDGADLAEEFGRLIGHDLPLDCNPLVAKDQQGKKHARTLGEITEFLNTYITQK